jgi:hypothetical protein
MFLLAFQSKLDFFSRFDRLIASIDCHPAFPSTSSALIPWRSPPPIAYEQLLEFCLSPASPADSQSSFPFTSSVTISDIPPPSSFSVSALSLSQPSFLHCSPPAALHHSLTPLSADSPSNCPFSPVSTCTSLISDSFLSVCCSFSHPFLLSLDSKLSLLLFHLHSSASCDSYRLSLINSVRSQIRTHQEIIGQKMRNKQNSKMSSNEKQEEILSEILCEEYGVAKQVIKFIMEWRPKTA